MLSLDAIRDPEQLCQVAVLLERENEKLHAKIQALTAELARLRGDTGAAVAQRELEFLKELLAQRERALFGASSERRPRPPAPEPTPPARRRGHGPTAQPSLPTVEWCTSSPPPIGPARSAVGRCGRCRG